MLICIGFFLYFAHLAKNDPNRIMQPGNAKE